MIRSFDALRPTGLLWLINTTVFHPRGYALAFHYDDHGGLVGWELLGDGSEPWQFATDGWPEGQGIDICFKAAQEILKAAPR